MSKKTKFNPKQPTERSQTPEIKTPALIFDEKRLALIFNEWNERYSKDPESFGKCLDEDGKPVKDYGENCAKYFQELYIELFSISQDELDKTLNIKGEKI